MKDDVPWVAGEGHPRGGRGGEERGRCGPTGVMEDAAAPLC